MALSRCPFAQFKTVLNHPALVGNGSLPMSTINKCPFLKRLATSIQHSKENNSNVAFPLALEQDVALVMEKDPFKNAFQPPKPDPMEITHEAFSMDAMMVINNTDRGQNEIVDVKIPSHVESPTSGFFQSEFISVLDKIKAEGRYRVFNDIERKVGNFPEATWHSNPNFPLNIEQTNTQPIESKEITVWCSNDYLGMGQNKEVLNAINDALWKFGAGSGGTRNISGSTKLHSVLEEGIADLHHKDRALVFGSCFTANMAAIHTISKILPGLIVFSDEKNHSSLIEGIKYAKVEKKIFAHNNVDHLEQLLQEVDISIPKLIIFESIYSMDGSLAPIAKICNLAKKYRALTFNDEVHAVGLYGNRGAGVAEEQNVMSQLDIISGTFGKAFGLYGGYLVSNYHIIDAIRSIAPGFIFTTSLPPCIVAGAAKSVEILKADNTLRIKQRERVQKLKSLLVAANLPVMETASHIVPLMVCDAAVCKKMSDHLLSRHGIYVQPINYPTVPRGKERFRLTTTPNHTDAQINHLVASFVSTWKAFGLTFGPYSV